LILYDVQRHRVHQLNRTAALVWQHCDGQKTVTELRKLLQQELDPAVDDTLIRQALERLGKAQLLRERLPRRHGMPARRLVRCRICRCTPFGLAAHQIANLIASAGGRKLRLHNVTSAAQVTSAPA